MPKATDLPRLYDSLAIQGVDAEFYTSKEHNLTFFRPVTPSLCRRVEYNGYAGWRTQRIINDIQTNILQIEKTWSESLADRFRL